MVLITKKQNIPCEAHSQSHKNQWDAQQQQLWPESLSSHPVDFPNCERIQTPHHSLLSKETTPRLKIEGNKKKLIFQLFLNFEDISLK